MAESDAVRLKPFSNISISGGTHGNELTGVYLVRHWMSNGAFVERNSFKTHLTLSNPCAIEKCVRYIDVDLNRQFTKEPIIPNDDKYEVQRACEIQNWIAANNVDFAIDIHNTTSNMGVTLILTSSATTPICLQISARIQEALDFPVHILTLKDSFKGANRGGGFTDLTGCGVGLEVGPLSHGTIKADIFRQSARAVSKILDVIDAFNNGEEFHAKEVEMFEVKGFMHYPCDVNGNITAVIHSELDGKDWQPLKKGDPLFMTFDGQTITYEEEEVIWPTFVNEAVYLKNDIAFATTKKVKLHVEAVKKV